MRSLGSVLLAVATTLLFTPAPARAQDADGDPQVLATMRAVNERLSAAGYHLAVDQIEFFTIGGGRPVNRLHQTGSRWVPNDPRRLAQGNDLTYLVDQSDGATYQLGNAQTESAIDQAMATWGADRCLRKVRIVKRPDTGADPDIYDYFFGFGDFGNPFLADIVNAGWLPPAFFAAVAGPGAEDSVLAFSATFVFTDGGVATDINGDHHQDTALNEVYYNLRFGEPGSPRDGNPWGINVALPGIDVGSIALHENGHSLELGHFGPPPTAAMNPVYAGMRQSPLSIDEAGACAVWASWPRP